MGVCEERSRGQRRGCGGGGVVVFVDKTPRESAMELPSWAEDVSAFVLGCEADARVKPRTNLRVGPWVEQRAQRGAVWRGGTVFCDGCVLSRPSHSLLTVDAAL